MLRTCTTFLRTADKKILAGQTLSPSVGKVSVETWDAPWQAATWQAVSSLVGHATTTQALLDEFRAKAAAVGLILRPPLRDWQPTSDAATTTNEESPSTSGTSTSPDNGSVEYSDCRVGFIRTKLGKQGVLQLHKAARLNQTVRHVCYCSRLSQFDQSESSVTSV